MSNQMYGSVVNRLLERQPVPAEIKVGDGVTEYLWSDRHAYEVTEVKDQKHIKIREYDHKVAGGPMSNDWELISNPDNPEIEIVKRGDRWYRTATATIEDAERMLNLDCRNEDDCYFMMWYVNNGFDTEKIKRNGKQTKYKHMNITIGHADYYYDYSF